MKQSDIFIPNIEKVLCSKVSPFLYKLSLQRGSCDVMLLESLTVLWNIIASWVLILYETKNFKNKYWLYLLICLGLVQNSRDILKSDCAAFTFPTKPILHGTGNNQIQLSLVHQFPTVKLPY